MKKRDKKQHKFFRLLKMVKPFSNLMFFSVLSGTLGHLSAIGLMAFSAATVATILNNGGVDSSNFPMFFAIGALVSGLLRGVLRLGEHYFGHDIAFRLLFEIRKQIFITLNRLAPAKLLDRKSGDIASAVIADVEFIEVFFAHTIAPIIMGILVPLTVLIVLAFQNWMYALCLLPFYLFMGFIFPVLSFKRAGNIGKQYRENLADLNSSMLEDLQGLKDLMLLNRDKDRLDSLAQKGVDNDKYFSKLKKHEGFVSLISEFIVVAAVGVNLIVSYHLYNLGVVSVGTVLFSLVLTASSFGPLFSLMFLSNSLLNTFAAADRIFALMDEEEAVSDCENPVVLDSVDSSPIIECVDFAYPRMDKNIFDNFSFKVDEGKMTSLVAESGRGKSTALYLIMRFFDPSRGRVVFNSKNLKDYQLNSLRENISYFTQDTVIFNTTVFENIKIANDSASDEDIYKAAKNAGIHNFIMSLPDKYDTIAGEGGDRFSSGEKQRIGLARMFLQDNQVILLDEPVSNLDYDNEQLIMANIKDGFKNHTIVLVSHRDSVRDFADKSVVLT